jgi:hypothetical protein
MPLKTLQLHDTLKANDALTCGVGWEADQACILPHGHAGPHCFSTNDVALLKAATLQARMRAFIAELLFDVWGFPSDVGEVDGFTLQELFAKHGLLEPEERAVPCNEGADETKHCQCLEDGGREAFPVLCYRIPQWLLDERRAMELRDAVERSDKGEGRDSNPF